MLQLPGNCRAGSFSVRPANWKHPGAKVKTIWSISYRFYDDNLQQSKKIVIKGCNRFTTLKEKQDYVREMLDYEKDLLLNQGYNYITRTYSLATVAELSGSTPVIDALTYAYGKLQLEKGTMAEIKSCLKCVSGVIRSLHFDRLPVSAIKRKHLKLVLEGCAKGKVKWSNNSHNHYRAYLLMLFKELLEMEAIETNPVRDIPKKKVIRKVRQELTAEERKLLREKVPALSPRFWIFLNIFYHSSSRETEMMRLRMQDVDLPGQRFKVMVKKGKYPFEEWRPIKDIALPYWKQATEGAKENDFIFSRGLKPGPNKIRTDQITKRYYKLKKNYGIKADVYSFKHSNLDEMAAALAKHSEAIKQTAEVAGHKGTVITMTYTQGETARRHATQKLVRNEL